MVIQQSIQNKLSEGCSPIHLQIVNESHMHAVPANSETHFKVVIVSDIFENMRPVARHQKIYGLLADEMAGEVHALAIHAYTPDEWSASGQVPDSPNCLGGSKAE